MRARRSRCGPAILLALLLCSSQAWGLTDEEMFRDFRFRFITPGARAVAMGGAFASVADNATAGDPTPGGDGWIYSTTSKLWADHADYLDR